MRREPAGSARDPPAASINCPPGMGTAQATRSRLIWFHLQVSPWQMGSAPSVHRDLEVCKSCGVRDSVLRLRKEIDLDTHPDWKHPGPRIHPHPGPHPLSPRSSRPLSVQRKDFGFPIGSVRDLESTLIPVPEIDLDTPSVAVSSISPGIFSTTRDRPHELSLVKSINSVQTDWQGTRFILVKFGARSDVKISN